MAEPAVSGSKKGESVMELGKNYSTSQTRSLLPPPANTVRNKVTLTPGHSLMDWIRLGKSGKDLTGVGGRKHVVTEEELAKHNTLDDCWMALGGGSINTLVLAGQKSQHSFMQRPVHPSFGWVKPNIDG